MVKIDTNEHSEYRWCGWHELGKWNNPDDITADKLAFTTEDMRKSVVLALELVEKEKREQLAKGRNGDMIPDAES